MTNFPEAAFISQFGSAYPKQVSWTNKLLTGVSANPPQANDINTASLLEGLGVGAFLGGKTTTGEWVDVVATKIWLKSALQKSVYALLLAKPKLLNTKIGYELLRNQVVGVLQEGVLNNGLLPDFKVGDVVSSDVSRRVIRLDFKATLSGAINGVDVSGTLFF